MANPGIPTRTSHGLSVTDLGSAASSTFILLHERSANARVAMAAGAVGDDVIRDLWQQLAGHEADLLEYRRASDFHDEYARYRGLAYVFDSTADVNAATDKIINLPVNHKFKTDHRVDFRIIEGALPGGLAEDTNYWLRTIDSPNGTTTLTTTEGGASDINLTNGTGRAEMILNIKPDYASLLTAVDAALDEIELNLTQRAPTYDRANLDFTYSTRSTVDTATLRTKLSDIEALIDVVAA